VQWRDIAIVALPAAGACSNFPGPTKFERGRVNDAVNAWFYAPEAAIVAIADREGIDT
jgi:hypothetical protein